jgi:uncharacterized protein (DUF305 family)
MARLTDSTAVKPAGDIDRDFVAMTVSHHQGAILARTDQRGKACTL